MFFKLCSLAALSGVLSVAGNDPPPPKDALAAEQVPTVPTGNHDIDEFNGEHILLTRALMAPKNVADAFGRRIAKHYIAMQLTVANRHPEYQWLITDASIDLQRLIERMRINGACCDRADSLSALLGGKAPNPTVTGADLTVLRGVAEKGQNLDPRNLTLRILQGSGTVAAGLLGITTFGPSFAPSVASFNGPFISAFQRVFPDDTVNQLHRLNDSAYAANILVPKHQARAMVVFIPMSMLLSREEQKKFYDDPYSVYSPCTDLRLLDAMVNGHPIAQLDLAPSITSVEIPAPEAAKFGTDNFRVTGILNGRNLDKATLEISGAPEGLTLKTTGTPTAEQIWFELASPKPLPPNTPITFVLRKPGAAPRSWTATAAWVPQRPTIASGGLTPAAVAQGEKKTIDITGTGFLPGSTLEVDDRRGLTIGDVNYVSTTKLQVEISVDGDAAVGSRKLAVRTVGGVSGQVTLSITEKPKQ